MAEDPLKRLTAFVLVAGFGLGCELAAHSTFWWGLLDLTVGCGAAAGAVRLTGRARVLTLAFAVLWFGGTLDEAGSGLLGGVGSVLLLAYRGPLLQLLLAVGSRGRSTRFSIGVAAAGWLAALLPFAVASPLTPVLAATVGGLLLLRASAGSSDARPAVRAAAAAAFALALLWGVAAAGERHGRVLLGLGDVAVGTAIAIALASASGFWAREAERALVIKLGAARRPGLPLTTRLARALADPELEVRYLVPDVGWVNERGDVVAPPVGERRCTRVAAPGGGEVVLVHGSDATADSTLARAAAAAAGLSLESARLDAEVRVQARDVDESRRRLLHAADDERRALEQRLSDRVLVRLRRVDRLLSGRGREAERRELWTALDELVALGRGLYPPSLAQTDLAGALREIATRAGLPVSLEIDGDPEALPEAERAAMWFVCSEALANVSRHAGAGAVRVLVRVSGDLAELEVEDDGCGGATLERGLRGLADRVEALGGRFSLSSPPGGPTIVRAVLIRQSGV